MKPQTLTTFLIAIVAITGCAPTAHEDPTAEDQTARDDEGPGIELSATMIRDYDSINTKILTEFCILDC